MNDVVAEIRRMTKDLQALQNAMQAAQHGPSLPNAGDGQFNEIVNPELAAEFKGVLDAVRHFLWRYADLIATKPHESVETDVDRGCRRLVAEMLQSLSRDAAPGTMKTAPGTPSFFERIDFVVSSRLAAEKLRRKLDRGAA